MDPRIPNLQDDLRAGRISRREFIQHAVLLGASLTSISSVLAACSPAQPAAPTAAPAPTEAAEPVEPAEPTAAPTDASSDEAPTEAPPAESKTLTLRLGVDVSNLDPAFHPSMADTIVLQTVHQGLVSFRPGTFELENILAETITPSDDGLRIDFKLREGVQFHGGYGELTAEDVKFSYERFIDEELDAPYKGDWEQLDHVEVTGKYEGTIILKEPFAPLWSSTLPADGGVIISKKAMEEKGLAGYATSPVGTGAYELVEWTPNQRTVLRRFEQFWGEAPEWDEVVFVPITEDSAAEIALETGELDFGFIAESAVERFEANPDFEVYEVVTMNYAGILMNAQHPNLQDINVRQAIRYGIDVPAIIEAVYDGKAERACALLAPGMNGYWADAPCYERDVELAKSYLEAAGLDSLDINIAVTNSEKDRALAEIVQANLAEVGINVEIDALEDATYWDGGFGEEGLQNRQLTAISWSTNNPDPSWVTMWFVCDQVLQWNWTFTCMEDYDEFHYAAIKELDPDARAEMYVNLQKAWDEYANVVWTVHPKLYFAGRSGLEPGLNPLGILIPRAFHSQ